MTPDERKALREAAEKATPGEWCYLFGSPERPHEDWGWVRSRDTGLGIARLLLNDASEEGLAKHRRDKTDPLAADATFIALANPATILSLLDALAASEARAEKAREALKQIAGIAPWDDSDAGYVDKARTTLKEITNDKGMR